MKAMNMLYAKKVFKDLEKAWRDAGKLILKRREDLSAKEKVILNKALSLRESIFLKDRSDHYFSFIKPIEGGSVKRLKFLLGYNY